MSDSWSVRDGARLAKVEAQTVKRWIRRGWLVARWTPLGYRFTLQALTDAQTVATLARQRRLRKVRALLSDLDSPS